jgi:hypothetical protein
LKAQHPYLSTGKEFMKYRKNTTELVEIPVMEMLYNSKRRRGFRCWCPADESSREKSSAMYSTSHELLPVDSSRASALCPD